MYKNTEASNINGHCDYKIQITNSYIDAKPKSKKTYIAIKHHKGGKKLDHYQLMDTIDAVLNNFDMIDNKNSMRDLIFETLVVETYAGAAKYDYASKNYRNYGLAQIRVETARDLQNYLKKNNFSNYTILMSLRNNKMSEIDNLLYNVPYSIAICGLYYIRCNSDIQNNINSINARAKAWKKYYNTYKGAGTVAIYESRVKNYYKVL